MRRIIRKIAQNNQTNTQTNKHTNRFQIQRPLLSPVNRLREWTNIILQFLTLYGLWWSD